MKRILTLGIYLMSLMVGYGQTNNDYNDFRKDVLNRYAQERNTILNDYQTFREKINSDYASFLRSAWSSATAVAPIKRPDEGNVVPPVIFEEGEDTVQPVEVKPRPLRGPILNTSPKPVAPIDENDKSTNKKSIKFYGLMVPVRLPVPMSGTVGVDGDKISKVWIDFSDGRYDNTVVDLLAAKKTNRLCDWAYMQLVEKLASEAYTDYNMSSILTAWILCQSGFQVRVARDREKVGVIFASNHAIFNRLYYTIDGMFYYVLRGDLRNGMNICNAKYRGETPLSLAITTEQNLGPGMSENRTIESSKYPNFTGVSAVNKNLIEFYNTFPTSAIGGNSLTRWAIYANAPFSTETKNILYPHLKEQLQNRSVLEAANMLLNWVQTGLVYEYDDKVWGTDRAFFAEETLYYPYSDCEDRAILYSRLVRDLLGLDVALIQYPGHLATAVKFNTSVEGDAMLINGERYIVCDPTYIGAPVGVQMPKLEHSKAQAIVLER